MKPIFHGEKTRFFNGTEIEHHHFVIIVGITSGVKAKFVKEKTESKLIYLWFEVN